MSFATKISEPRHLISRVEACLAVTSMMSKRGSYASKITATETVNEA